MGADGGLDIAKLKDPKDYDSISMLLRPFNAIFGDDSKTYGKYHNIYLNKNKHIRYPNYIITYYGTFLNNYSGISSVKQIIKEIQHNRYKDKNFTIEEKWFNLITKPYISTKLYSEDFFEELLIESFEYFDYNEVNNCLSKIKDIKLIDWANELNDKIESFQTIETWT